MKHRPCPDTKCCGSNLLLFLRINQSLYANAAALDWRVETKRMIAFKRSAAVLAEIDRRIDLLRDAQRGSHSLTLNAWVEVELQVLLAHRELELRWWRRLGRAVGLVPTQEVGQ